MNLLWRNRAFLRQALGNFQSGNFTERVADAIASRSDVRDVIEEAVRAEALVVIESEAPDESLAAIAYDWDRFDRLQRANEAKTEVAA